jgi:hypothetical protein
VSTSNEDADKDEPAGKAADEWLARGRSLKGPLSVAASLVGVAAVPVWAVRLFDNSYVPFVTATYVCLTGLTFIALAIYLQLKLNQSRQNSRRAGRLARSQETIAKVFEHLSKAAVLMTAGGDQRMEIREQGTQSTQRLAEAFAAITGAPCRVTVKQVFYPDHGERLAVRDLFRSHPAEVRPEDHVDWVDENTDFEEILASGAKFWLCDNIEDEFNKRYKNSHITPEKAKRGEVPYRSVLVVRIAGPGAPVELAGFLCVDSLEIGIFKKNFDVSTVSTVAHAMYSILMWHRQTEDASAQEAE